MKVGEQGRKLPEKNTKVADLPNHLRSVKFLKCQQNGAAGARIANAKEDQVGEEVLWEIQCFGKHQLQVLSRDVKLLECQQNEAGTHNLRTWEVQCFGKHQFQVLSRASETQSFFFHCST